MLILKLPELMQTLEDTLASSLQENGSTEVNRVIVSSNVGKMYVIKLEIITVNFDVHEMPLSQSLICFQADVHCDERTSGKRLPSSWWYSTLS